MTRFAEMYLSGGTLDRTQIFPADVLSQFVWCKTAPFRIALSAGKPPTARTRQARVSRPSQFGHTGFTGTSLWMDPTRDLFVLLLTNRVNPTRANTKIGAVRIALANAVVAALEGPAPKAAESSPR